MDSLLHEVFCYLLCLKEMQNIFRTNSRLCLLFLPMERELVMLAEKGISSVCLPTSCTYLMFRQLVMGSALLTAVTTIRSMLGPSNVIRMACAFIALPSLSFDTSLQLVVMLGMMVTSLNLRQLRGHSHTLVRLYQSKLCTGVKIRQQKRGEGVKECKCVCEKHNATIKSLNQNNFQM